MWVVAALTSRRRRVAPGESVCALGLVLLGPVIVTILCYHVFLNSTGIALALVVTILWFIVLLTGIANTSQGYLFKERDERYK